MPLCSCARNLQQLGRFVNRQAGEIPKLYQFGLLRLHSGELTQYLVEAQQLIARRLGQRSDRVQVNPLAVAAMSNPPPLARTFNENPADRFRSRRKEMSPRIPPLSNFNVHQSNVRLVNQ